MFTRRTSAQAVPICVRVLTAPPILYIKSHCRLNSDLHLLYYGQCSKCKVPPGLLGEHQTFMPCDQSSMIDTYLLADANMRAFYSACNEAELKLIYHPFWEFLPHIDIFLSITPDILHQMLQEMVKHLIEWLVRIFGPLVINA